MEIMEKVDRSKRLKTLICHLGNQRLEWFHLVEGGSYISHLKFADDTIIFFKETKEEVRKLLIILLLFEVLTGLKLNSEKSSITSIGADDIVQELGCKLDFLPITYLGMPIGAGRRSVVIWEVVIQKMQRKLAPWKRKYLNKAGRVVLISTTLESLAVYFMSLHYLLVSVEKRLNTIMRKFLWGEDENNRKMSWIIGEEFVLQRKKEVWGLGKFKVGE
ncbi:uncharacterized protein LOC113346118 [Papaver somniferum]|uniref:uncharacterized protein LOC113346118 n=1 Tax=Papaver somniferum TaxID=3469 RepID=UPI000E700945|nr:uncharacterized protein LOC113346118 [Papaver somniferum]